MLSKIDALRHYLADLPHALICFSGGIDSTLVLAVAQEQLGPRTLAFTAIGPSISAAERTDARRIAENIGARHLLVETEEMQREAYVRNAPDRCYHCKTELYLVAHRVAKKAGLTVVLNGTNVDDLGDYRPGLVAAKEHGVRSPLAELGFTKADVRDAAKTLGLDTWDKPAAACLSSRIPYGTSVTVERLEQIAQLESFLKAAGVRHVRVRHHDNLARIEVAPPDFPKLVDPAFAGALHQAGRDAGFLYVTLDLAGYRQGSHNETLPNAKRSLPLAP